MVVASSTHQEAAPEARAGCNADRRCIRLREQAATEQPRVRRASRSAAFLLALRRRLAWLLLAGWLCYVHLLSVFKRIGGVDDDLIGGGDAAENLQCGAVVAPNVDGP